MTGRDARPAAGAREVIERLALERHPEGGWFRETHRSEVTLARSALPDGYPGDRRAMTAILFLLADGERSRWHRVRGEELWVHQAGDPLRLAYRSAMGEGSVHTLVLGTEPGAQPQAVVPPGRWQAATGLSGKHGYALACCVVAPGFEFDDFELGDSAHPEEDEA